MQDALFAPTAVPPTPMSSGNCMPTDVHVMASVCTLATPWSSPHCEPVCRTVPARRVFKYLYGEGMHVVGTLIVGKKTHIHE
jgi:hypothetical protein